MPTSSRRCRSRTRARARRVDFAQAVPRDVRALEMLSPRNVDLKEPLMERLQCYLLRFVDLAVRGDDEVDVTVRVRVADSKRSL